MAIIKHIAMKSGNYTGAIHYLLFQHDEFTQKEIVDEYGVPLLREEYYFDGINCEPYAFDFECSDLNRKFHKNNGKGEIKQHHYIISFDPKDVTECGLNGNKAQALGMEYAKENFPGHQMIVCTHTDGHNKSGNIHVHIVLNSLRKNDVDAKPFMEREIDSKAGYKHHVTPGLLHHLKKSLMDLCHREQLHQVDLLHPPKKRITEKEYYANRRAKEKAGKSGTTKFETQKDYLRKAIEDCAGKSNNEETFRTLLKEKYGITLTISRGRYGYIHPDRGKPVRERMLGTDYEEKHLQEIFEKNEKRTVIEQSARSTSRRIHTILPSAITKKSGLKLVTDLQSCAKAQANHYYARKVRISNLQKMAETIAYAQEHNFDSYDDVERMHENALQSLRTDRKALDSIKEELRDVNEQIHFTGQYLSTKKAYAGLKNTKDKKKYSNEHNADLIKFEASRDYLRKRADGKKLPTLASLKQQKAGLIKRQESLYASMEHKRDAFREIDTMLRNMDAILAIPDGLHRSSYDRTRPAPARPSR
ncbi:MAG: relaxase/mobilization nuclease domain-containing protein [Lachnospiraceae bacterium]|nr:relaxase/mobilization nuclease domain-containing protein [Lachnospiraceae bacterium]